MKNILTVLAFLMPIAGNTALTLDEFKAKDPQVYKDIAPDGGYQGFLYCTVRMVADSEGKLNNRLSELRQGLDGLSLKEYRVNFEHEQVAWQAYKTVHCTYLTTGMERQAHQIQKDMCDLSENYKRLETLEG